MKAKKLFSSLLVLALTFSFLLTGCKPAAPDKDDKMMGDDAMMDDKMMDDDKMMEDDKMMGDDKMMEDDKMMKAGSETKMELEVNGEQ